MSSVLRHLLSVNSFGVINKFGSFLVLHYHTKSLKSNQTLKHYLESGEPIKALLNFRHRFRESSSFIDSFSVLFAIKASSAQKAPSFVGKQIHALVIKLGFHGIIQIRTSLLSFYSAAGDLAGARQVFDETPDKQNVVLWTAMIAAYTENENTVKAIELFQRMEAERIELDEVIVTVALSACADLGAVQIGERIYSRSIKRRRRFATDLTLRNSLLNMYVKSGDIEKARKVFDETLRKDVTTYTSMIFGYALNGQAQESLELFKKMKSQDSSVTPNDVTFIGVLMACSHGGLVEEGQRHFKSMVEDYNLKPRDAHFGCMVDLFCRSGRLKDAQEFINQMPVKPNAVIWRTLLGACSLLGNVELGEEVQRRIFELDRDHVGDYVALSNIYAAKGMWDEKWKMRGRVRKRREPGKSWIEMGNVITEFVSGDDDNEKPMLGKISEILSCFVACITSYGYLEGNFNSSY